MVHHVVEAEAAGRVGAEAEGLLGEIPGPVGPLGEFQGLTIEAEGHLGPLVTPTALLHPLILTMLAP